MDLTSLRLAAPHTPLVVMEAGEVTLADVEMRRTTEVGSKPAPLKRLTDRHHALARLIAAGTKYKDAAIIVGLTANTVSLLMDDPTFGELVEFYRGELADEYQGMHAQLAGLGIDAVVELRERIEREPDKISMNALMDLVKLTADRTGHGPSTSTKAEVNINVGLADRLAEARKRTAAAIEARARDITPESSGD